MKAALFTEFGRPLTIETVPDPAVPPDGVVIAVRATGICRSDWHGWMGHDSDVQLPHVPGHELAGEITAVGSLVKNWHIGDRVTTPFCVGCGHCAQCAVGDQQNCDNYFQPGFTAWGSFAEYVAIPHADVNLVRLPESMSFVEAATLGCRFITAYRAVVAQGRTTGGEWVVVHGCGGVGLSAVMIAAALGAQVIAVDIRPEALALAQKAGAQHTLNAANNPDLLAQISELTEGGAHVALDALGSAVTCRNTLLSLRKRGRHVQVGLLLGADKEPALPLNVIISKELEMIGSHGMQAHAYPPMMRMIADGRLRPGLLLERTVGLVEATAVLTNMDAFPTTGVVVINDFK
ncbi:MAG: zinc-dependent alcohol dehydrogenase family protein [Anaerolineales bacterium]|nr:zinc-dependent alcohol dehydrogenase family protein [Anaerolineales bacterium]